MSKRPQFVSGGCVLSLNMDDNAATTTVVDNSGYGNHGTFNDADGDPNTDAHSVAGKIGTALNFDGSDDYVDCGNDESLDITDAITIEAWVNSTTDEGYHRVIVGKISAWQFEVTNTTSIVYFVFENVGEIGLSGGTALKNNWYHLVTTYKPGEWKFFVNGIEANSRNDITDKMAISSNNAFIGKRTDAQHWNGTIDEVRIFNRALTANEIKAHYLGSRHLAV